MSAKPLLSILFLILMISACSNDWRTDMWYQPSHRPEDSPLPEPEHSIPLGAAPRFFDRDETETFKNPNRPTSVSLSRGKHLFTERCACCHGPEGHGGGPVSKFFPPAPDLAFESIKAHSDGYIFGTITLGGRAMPPQAEGLSLRDRWDLVTYVRFIQGIVMAEMKK